MVMVEVYAESNGGPWILVGGAYIASNTSVSVIALSGNQIYAGVNNFNNGSSFVYVESGNGWSLFGESAAINNGEINTIAIRDNQVYVGGIDYSNFGGAIYVESNNIWNRVNSPLIESSRAILSLVSSGDKLYAGGSIRGQQHNLNGIAYMESNGIWSVIGGGIIFENGEINSLAVNGNQIYAGGQNPINGNTFVYLESGFGWNQIGSNTSNTTYSIVIALNESSLYAGNGDGSILQFGSSNWTPLITGSICSSEISPMINYNNSIYASCSNAIFVESGNTINLIGGVAIESMQSISSIAVSDNGTVYAGGKGINTLGVVYFESNNVWYLLGESSVLGGAFGNVNSIAVKGNKVYAGGYDGYGYGLVYVESGNGWNLVGGGPVESYGQVTAILLVDDRIYVAGLNQNTGVPGLYIESRNSWNLESSFPIIANGNINSLTSMHNKIYVSVTAGNQFVLNSMVYVKSGNHWSMAGGSYLPESAPINSLLVDTNEDVYVSSNNHIYVSKGGIESWALTQARTDYSTLQITSMVFKNN